MIRGTAPGCGRSAFSLYALASLLLGLSVLPGWAQTITVTAGEHVGFTRVVLQARAGFPWRVDDSGDDLVIVTPGHGIVIDQARVFGRIPRTRLASLDAERHTLRFTLACPQCTASINEERPGLLIIDISDQDPRNAARPAPPPHSLALEAVPSTHAQAAALAGAALATMHAARSRDRDRMAEDHDNADTAARALAQVMLAAITHGLVNPAEVSEATEPSLLQVPAFDGIALPPNLRLRDSDAQTVTAADPEPSERQASCPDEMILDFAQTPVPPPFATELSSIHGRLYGEFDQPDNDAVLELAKHYLRWGFGAEARVVLANAEGIAGQRDLLIAVADVIEGHHGNARQRLAALGHCQGAFPLLAHLAGGTDPLSGSARDGVVSAFQMTPPGLRAIFGPPLIDSFLNDGAVDAARMSLSALRRSDHANPADLDRLSAAIDAARGHTDSAARRLDDGNRDDIRSLALRIEIANQRQEPLDAQRLGDAAVLSAAARGHADGRRLAEATIHHHALIGDVAPGFELLDRLETWLEPTRDARDRVAALRHQLWSAALETEDDPFLAFILQRSDWLVAGQDAELGQALDRRLAELGLYGLAAALSATAQGNGSGDTDAPDTLPLAQPGDATTAASGQLDRLQPFSTQITPPPVVQHAETNPSHRPAAEMPRPSENARPQATPHSMPDETGHAEIGTRRANETSPRMSGATSIDPSTITDSPGSVENHQPITPIADMPDRPERNARAALPSHISGSADADPMRRSIMALEASDALRIEFSRLGVAAP